MNVLANDESHEDVMITDVGMPSDGGQARSADDGRSVIYTPAAGFIGVETMSYTISDNAGNESLAMMEIQVVKRWHNDRHALDTTGDGLVVPLDAIVAINYINAYGSGPLPMMPGEPQSKAAMIDVNGDGIASPIDILLVINELDRIVSNRTPVAAEGEASNLAPSWRSPHPDESRSSLDAALETREPAKDTPFGTAATASAAQQHREPMPEHPSLSLDDDELWDPLAEILEELVG